MTKIFIERKNFMEILDKKGLLEFYKNNNFPMNKMVTTITLGRLKFKYIVNLLYIVNLC